MSAHLGPLQNITFPFSLGNREYLKENLAGPLVCKWIPQCPSSLQESGLVSVLVFSYNKEEDAHGRE